MSLRLVACPSCSNYIKASEPACIVCGKKLRSDGVVGRTAGAVLMGLSLAGCPADDTTGDSMAGTESQPSTGTETSTSTVTASSTTVDPSTGTTEATDPDGDSTTFAGESAYGVPGTGTTIETETSAETDTDTDTDTDGSGTTAPESESTAVSPDYGVPDTSP